LSHSGGQITMEHREKHAQYIVWEPHTLEHPHHALHTRLRALPYVTIVKADDPQYIVVRMDADTAQDLRTRFPELCIEENFQYRRITSHQPCARRAEHVTPGHLLKRGTAGGFAGEEGAVC
jgi:hypothetical protein